MIIRTRHFSRLVVCPVGITAFPLAGYEIDEIVELQADGSTKIDLTSEDSDGIVTKIEQTYEDFRVMLLGQAKFVRNPKIGNVIPPREHTTCRVTSNGPLARNLGLTENKDTHPFTLPDLHEDTSVFSKFQVRAVVTMLGKVIKASDDEISGNKVIVDNFDFANRGVFIMAQKGQGSPADKSAGPSGRESGASSLGSGGFPVWGWAGVGTGAVAVVAVAAFAAGCRKHTDD